jgi:NADPH:quinone reductase-like Zn-dependent oxidoreductase
VFDVFGDLRFARARAGLRRRGVFISTVLTPRRLVRELVTRFSLQQERLIVVNPNRADLTQLGAWLADRQLRSVIDSRFALCDYEAAFHKLESKHTHGKIVIDVDVRASAPPSATK